MDCQLNLAFVKNISGVSIHKCHSNIATAKQFKRTPHVCTVPLLRAFLRKDDCLSKNSRTDKQVYKYPNVLLLYLITPNHCTQLKITLLLSFLSFVPYPIILGNPSATLIVCSTWYLELAKRDGHNWLAILEMKQTSMEISRTLYKIR